MDDQLTTAYVHETNPFAAILGMQVVSVTRERVEIRFDWKRELTTDGDRLHGGALMALADTVGAYVATANLPDGAAGTTTMESKTNFLRAATVQSPVTAVGRPLHAGSTTCVIETEIRNDAGTLLAKTTQTQMVLRPR